MNTCIFSAPLSLLFLPSVVYWSHMQVIMDVWPLSSKLLSDIAVPTHAAGGDRHNAIKDKDGKVHLLQRADHKG